MTLTKTVAVEQLQEKTVGMKLKKKKIFLELLILREKKNFFRGFAIKREKEMRQ